MTFEDLGKINNGGGSAGNQEPKKAPPLSVYFDRSVYSRQQINEILMLLSELYHLETGDELVVENIGGVPFPKGLKLPLPNPKDN